MPCAPRTAGARDGRANRGASPGPYFRCNRGDLRRGIEFVESVDQRRGDLSSTEGLSLSRHNAKACNKRQDAKKQSKELCHCFKRRSTSSSHLDAGQNLRPAGSQPPARPPPNQEPSLICASTFDVAWRRSRRGFSLSLTAWYRDTASAESLQRLSRVSRHHFGSPEPATGTQGAIIDPGSKSLAPPV